MNLLRSPTVIHVAEKSDRELLEEAVLILRRLESLIARVMENPLVKRFVK